LPEGLSSSDSYGKIKIGFAHIEAVCTGAVSKREALCRCQSLLLLIGGWVKSGPSSLRSSNRNIEPKLPGVSPKAFRGKEEEKHRTEESRWSTAPPRAHVSSRHGQA